MTDMPESLNDLIRHRRELSTQLRESHARIIEELGSLVGQVVEVQGYKSFTVFGMPNREGEQIRRTAIPNGSVQDPPTLHTTSGIFSHLSRNGDVNIESHEESAMESIPILGSIFSLSGLVSVKPIQEER